MFLFRFLGSWFLVLGVIALVYDGVRTLGGDGDVMMTALGTHWFKLHPDSLNAAQAGIERYVAAWLWNPVIVSVLKSPAWMVALVLALLCFVAGRRRNRVKIYSN